MSGVKNNLNFRIPYTLFQIKIENGPYKGTLEKERRCRSYTIIEVPETNVFLVTKSATCHPNRSICT